MILHEEVRLKKVKRQGHKSNKDRDSYANASGSEVQHVTTHIAPSRGLLDAYLTAAKRNVSF